VLERKKKRSDWSKSPSGKSTDTLIYDLSEADSRPFIVIVVVVVIAGYVDLLTSSALPDAATSGDDFRRSRANELSRCD